MAKPSTPKNAPGSRIDQHCTEIICAKFQIPITFCSILSGRPQLLSRSDGKRPDGMSLIPWREGRSVLWDVTIRDTTADSYLSKTSSAAGAAAEEAAVQKESKYADLCTDYLFCPVAIETLGPICSAGRLFLSELGRRASLL